MDSFIAPPRAAARSLVLLVDADDTFRAGCTKVLQDAGCEVVGADNVELAFRLALTTRPDAIVTELALRPHDGWALLRALKREPLTCDIPVVVLTSDSDSDGVHDLVRHAQGAVCLVKPCPPEVIALELMLVLGERPHPRGL